MVAARSSRWGEDAAELVMGQGSGRRCRCSWCPLLLGDGEGRHAAPVGLLVGDGKARERGDLGVGGEVVGGGAPEEVAVGGEPVHLARRW